VDWHLLEVSIVTILAIWVYLFSPSALSRGVAVVMLAINIIWVLLERERAGGGRRRLGDAPEQQATAPEHPTGDTAAGDEAQGTPAPRDSRII
jgi:hypothetical protein